MDISELEKMMSEVSEATTAPAPIVSAPAPAANNSNGFNSDPNRPNIYMDTNIVPKELDKSKVKSSKTYAVIGVNENPSEEITTALMKIVEILKAKKMIYRYDNSILPTLARDVFMKQDLTMPHTYQLFLPWYKKEKFDLEGIATVTSKWPTPAAASIAKFYSKVIIKDKTDRSKVVEEFYGFSRTTGAGRSNMSNAVHLYLGKDCLTKLKFLILYSSCGCETMEDVKAKGYKEVDRAVQNTIKRCKDFDVPVYNIGKTEGMTKLLQLISTIE